MKVVRDVKEETKQVASTSNNDDLCLMLKYVGLGNAAGNIGNSCFIMACDALKEDEFFVREVHGLNQSTSTDGSSKGWLYMSKTKAGSPSLWAHYFTNVLIPTIDKSRAQYDDDCTDVDEVLRRAFLMSDGEAIIMNAVFTPMLYKVSDRRLSII